MILDSFFKALAQLGDPRFRHVLFKGIGLTIALLFGAYALVFVAINTLVGGETTLPLIGQVAWVDDLLSWGSIILMILLSTVLMVPVASAITSMFLEDVAQAVEDKHYPYLPAAESIPFLTALKDTLNFLGVLIVANLLALILYVMFAPAAPLIFWALNGFLLGREYFTLVASRRIGITAARALRSKHAATIWLAGALMAIPLSVPLVNLIVPILGAATFTHVFHRLNTRVVAA
ncbi:EI24 domain-containing protein [Epibacterium ulvae]|uniref:EI24 domain-containing protein n=1 Tax=Epibacterium ulvae TaxID=1156985 RepID=UPI001BFC0E90|nr:EI24 domain-containing protein [Epibacterium ulvae]MBT8154939.1 EI24 domain-containing protein [Epibacterium ulvae]